MHPSRGLTRTLRSVGIAAVVILGIAGCGDDDDSGVSINDPRDQAETTVAEALVDVYDGVNVEVGAPPICDLSFADDGTVTGSCEGVDELATDISATVDGTADVDEETCSVDVVASRDGEEVAEETGIDCFEES